MVTVAVVAGGHRRRRIRFAERHGFAMVGVPVMLEPVLMAFTATLVADGLEVVAFGIGDVMRGVAIGADRSARVTFGEQLPVNALDISFLDTEMALATSPGDVDVIDG